MKKQLTVEAEDKNTLSLGKLASLTFTNDIQQRSTTITKQFKLTHKTNCEPRHMVLPSVQFMSMCNWYFCSAQTLAMTPKC